MVADRPGPHHRRRGAQQQHNPEPIVYTSIDNNDVPAVIYGDFRASYRWNDHIQLYGALDNTFNAPPPNIPTVGGGGTSCIIYDCIGRTYRVGVRFDD